MNLKALYLVLLIPIVSISITCNAQEHSKETPRRQFDFWLGDWNVYKFGTDTIVGISSIQSRLDNYLVEENYQSLHYRYKGNSMNVYDEKKGQWEQFYMDNKGLKLHLQGSFDNNRMVLSDCGGKVEDCNRIIWTDMGDNTVRQEWEQSNDFGKTWKKVFDGHYRKRE